MEMVIGMASDYSCSRLVMRGQKRGEDARKRAYDPRIHRNKKRFIQADGLHRNSGLPGVA
jgi:hypothetical protein